MKRSTDRILTTHPGRLPNPSNYARVMQARRGGDKQNFDEQTTSGIQEMIRRQREIGIDILSDGEFWKGRDQQWYDDRCSGISLRPLKEGEAAFNELKARREGRMPEFRDFYEIYDQVGNTPMPGATTRNPRNEMYHVIAGPVQVAGQHLLFLGPGHAVGLARPPVRDLPRELGGDARHVPSLEAGAVELDRTRLARAVPARDG